MGNFSEEFEKRLRRVCGVDNDNTKVQYEMDYDVAGYYGCETCGDYTDGGAKIVVTVFNLVHQYRGPIRAVALASKEFKDLGELMRALEGVEL